MWSTGVSRKSLNPPNRAKPIFLLKLCETTFWFGEGFFFNYFVKDMSVGLHGPTRYQWSWIGEIWKVNVNIFSFFRSTKCLFMFTLVFSISITDMDEETIFSKMKGRSPFTNGAWLQKFKLGQHWSTWHRTCFKLCIREKFVADLVPELSLVT